MDRTSRAKWSTRLPPLTAQQQQAAAESHDYAVAHGLVLGFDTADHLRYHDGAAADEHRRIPAAERSLADDHLQPLIIPPAVISEPWTVPRRVAVVLEAACRWLADDELKACEAAVVCGARRKRPQGLPRLELPLLCSDHDEDCAELQRAVAALSGVDEARLRDHEEPLDNEDELFAVPKEACDYTAHLEETIRTETMEVSEQAIRSLVALMGSMTWTDDDRVALVDQQIARPVPVQRCVSPPLPPVLSPIEYFVPEGDVCIVADASDFGSGVSEALDEAEQLLMDTTGERWTDEAANAGASVFDTEGLSSCPSYTLESLCLPPLGNGGSKQESDLALPPSPRSSASIPHDEPEYTKEDQKIFSAWIDESIFAQEEPQYRNPDANLSGSAYEDVTAESLLSLEENEIVAQAKIPVPAVGIDASLPSWNSVGACASEMLQWMMGNDKEAFCIEEWLPDRSSRNTSQHDEQLHLAAREWDQKHTEKFKVDQLLMNKIASCFNTVLDIQDMLINSVQPIQPSQRVSAHEEELEMPLEKAIPKLAQKDRSSWGNLMNRWKRRKKDSTGEPSTSQGTDSLPTTPQQRSKITAPELLIGFRAFADSSMQVAKTKIAHDTGQSGSRRPSPVAVESSPAVPDGPSSTQSPQPLISKSSAPSKAIFSIAIPRMIRTCILKSLPNLQFIERDYHREYDDTDTNDEADIVASPSTGIVMATMVGLRQTDAQRHLVFQGRVTKVAGKYETLHILIYRNNARPAREGADDLPELSPSDTMAFSQLQVFVRGLPCKVSVLYISGGEQAVAQSVVSLLSQGSSRDVGNARTERFLVEAETRWELFLRQAGLNVYDAQIVLGILREASGHSGSASDTAERDCISKFNKMSPDERLHLFESEVGCRRALDKVSCPITKELTASGHLSSSHICT